MRSIESDNAVAGTFGMRGLGRWVAYVAFGLIATTVVLATAIFVLLDRFDLGPLAASRASAALGPPVTVAELHVMPGRWLTVELRGVQTENIPGGTRPEMAALQRLTAEVARGNETSGFDR